MASPEKSTTGTGESHDALLLQACNLREPVRYAPPPPEQVLEDDKNTPDEWVPRSADLIRLTGRHPLNCEPPLSALLARAWPLTPPALLYVRNHGRVPRVDDASHRLLLRVPSPDGGGGGVAEHSFSMADIRAFPARHVAATLACAGLRRKEVAMLAPVQGFNWGAASLGTCMWTGAPLCELLRGAGVTAASDDAQFICFTGAPDEVPLGDGTYGTCIPLAAALDPAADVLLAYAHNGAALAPDHGFPLRALVPGYIGGRSVKWLSRIEVTAAPSRNYYHTHDNKILPPEVDHARADAERWWAREEYCFNEFNVNSAIAEPAHGARVALQAPGGGLSPLALRGWALSGGGRAVTRVELTFNGGATWHLAALPAPPWERGNAAGRHWCAAEWRYELRDARELLLCDEVAVRAVDAANNTQPEHITWNLKGMGNNAWYRVRVHKERCEAAPGGVALRFEAPVQPDGLKGGWMGHTPGGFKPPRAPPPGGLALEAPGTPRQEGEQQPAAQQQRRKHSERRVSREELAQHASDRDCWVAIAGGVYNPTRFLKEHPGGAFPIVANAGKDATAEFESIHSPHAWRMLDDYLVGELEPQAAAAAEVAPRDDTEPWVTLPPSETRPPRGGAEHTSLNPHKRLPFTLTERIEVNHDTRIFRFALPSAEHALGMPPGTHVFLSANIANHRVVRPYTPISPGHTKGFFELLIKIYFPTDGRPGGLMSTYMDGLRPGAQVHVRGPLGHIEYVGRGVFFVQDEQVKAADVGCVAGGTGITPIYQVLQAAAADADDRTRISLVYCNKTPADILLRKELDALAAQHPDRIRVWHVVDEETGGGDAAGASSSWEHSTGRLSADILAAHLPPASARPAIFLCGPPGLERAARSMLGKLGYDEDRIADFYTQPPSEGREVALRGACDRVRTRSGTLASAAPAAGEPRGSGSAGSAEPTPGSARSSDDRGPVPKPSTVPGKHNFLIWRVLFELDVRYTPIKPLGKGAYGVVCSASDAVGGERVAIKKISNAFENSTDARRTLREIQLLRHLRHDNVVGLFDVLRPPSYADFNDVYIVYELMDTDLHQIIRSPQPLTDEHCQYFVYQVLRGLKYIHSANVLHRDLKPSNLLLNANCDLKICDFGLARTGNAEKGLLTEYVVTRWYRAPELLLSCEEYTGAIDMWSVGCIFAEMLGRKPAFPGKDYIHQLKLILEVLGTQDAASLHFISSPKAAAWIQSLPAQPPASLPALFPTASPEALALLSAMLVFDPRKRISVDAALAHPYLASLHDPALEPGAATPFVADGEEAELKEEQLRRKVYDEIMKYGPPAGSGTGQPVSPTAAP